MERDDLLKILFELFMDLPRMNRFIDGANSFGLTPFEIGLLLEISATPNISVKNLLQFYSSDRTLLDRSVLALANLNFIKFSQSKRDKRERFISVTSTGLRALKSFDEVYNSLILRFKKYGNESQLRQVVDFFRLIADNLGQQQRPLRSGEHPYRCQQRRITRALKLHDKKWFGGDLNAQSIQILSQLQHEVDEQTPSELGETFSIATPLLQLTLRILFQEGLVSISTHGSDKRKKIVSITSRGKQALAVTEQKAVRLLRLATSKLSEVQLKKHVLEFNYFLRGLKQLNDISIRILPVSEKFDFKKSALKLLVDNDKAELLPTRFLSEYDNIAVFYFKNKFIGFAQYEVNKITSDKSANLARKIINVSVNCIDNKYQIHAHEVKSSLIWKFNKLYSRTAIIQGL
jgi:DNA-binding MarR family transcriptional regulator